MKCNLCGCSSFVDMNTRKAARCADCGSLERTRLLWLYLERLPLGPDTKILHLAPEQGLYDRLLSLSPGNYVPADIDPSRYAFAKTCRKIDLCELDAEKSAEFDLIVHCHVLEHVPCNVAYTLFHLHRMLKTGGINACVIPFMPGKYDESLQDLSHDERLARFGQFDHVRRFGSEDIRAHLGSIVKVPERFDATDDFSPEILKAANIPEPHWRGFHISTILMLKKQDLRLAESDEPGPPQAVVKPLKINWRERYLRIGGAH